MAAAELETIDETMVRRITQWLAAKGKGLGEWHHEPERRPLFARKPQAEPECRSLLAAQIRAIVIGARRDGLVFNRFDCGEE